MLRHRRNDRFHYIRKNVNISRAIKFPRKILLEKENRRNHGYDDNKQETRCREVCAQRSVGGGLKFAIPGKVISTPSGERVMYTLADDRVMFLDLVTANRMDELGVNVREKFFVCRPPDGKGNGAWRVWLSPETEQARAKEITQKNEVAEQAEVGQRETPLEQQLLLSIEATKQGRWGEVGD